jgi:hypothetical protein
MRCPICDDFERALVDRTSEYRKARSNTVYCRISSRFVAYSEIEMARARSELEIHRSVCASAIARDRARPVLASVSAISTVAPSPRVPGPEPPLPVHQILLLRP